MDAPPGFENLFSKRRVCRLKKSLYGLKWSPRTWFERFINSLRRYGITQSQGDGTLFFKWSPLMKLVFVIYVDDVIITSDDLKEIKHFKTLLAKEFEIKDLGTLRYIMAMEVARSR